MKILVLTNDTSSRVFYLRIARYKSFFADNGIDMELVQLSTKKTARAKQFAAARQYDAVILAGIILNSIEQSILSPFSKLIISDIAGRSIGCDLLEEHAIDKLANQLKMSKLVITCNDYLAQVAIKYAQDVVVLPTAVEVKKYLPMRDRAYDSKVRLVWIGDHDTLHYLINIAPVLEEIANRYHEVVMRVISDKYFKLRNMEVEPVRNKLEYTYNALTDCDIGLAPLREGKFSNMLCGFNIKQMFSAGLPVIASPVGENGEMVHHEVNGLLAQNTDQWINSLSLLIENLGIGSQYGAAGRILMKENYDASIIAKQFLDVLKEFDQQ